MERKPNYHGLPISLQTFGLLVFGFFFLWSGFAGREMIKRLSLKIWSSLLFSLPFLGLFFFIIFFLFVFFITEMKPEFTFIIIPFPFHLKVWYVCYWNLSLPPIFLSSPFLWRMLFFVCSHSPNSSVFLPSPWLRWISVLSSSILSGSLYYSFLPH